MEPEETEETEVTAAFVEGPLPDELRDAERARKELTYSQRVGAAFLTYIALYAYMHEDHDVKASTVSKEEREKRADHATELAIEMQRAMIGLIGTHRRRTYAHDFVYGMHQLYRLFAKPWNAATEGSEHAHQEMKLFFHHLACHNGRGKHGSCYQVLRLRVVKQVLMRDHARIFLPWSEYAAQRCHQVLGLLDANQQQPSPAEVQKLKRAHKATGSLKGEKKYKQDSKMAATCEAVKEQLCARL